jgi:hypothetical protein
MLQHRLVPGAPIFSTLPGESIEMIEEYDDGMTGMCLILKCRISSMYGLDIWGSNIRKAVLARTRGQPAFVENGTRCETTIVWLSTYGPASTGRFTMRETMVVILQLYDPSRPGQLTLSAKAACLMCKQPPRPFRYLAHAMCCRAVRSLHGMWVTSGHSAHAAEDCRPCIR